MVKVETAALNFSDLLMIEDRYQVRPPRPFIPGQEIAGTVAALGEGCALTLDQRVAGKVDWGGFAEYAVMRGDMAINIPDRIAADAAVALPVVYTTAMVALTESTQIKLGETVLVLAAAGGIGLAAVEIAHALGARVIAAASGADKGALAREHGADAAIDYRGGGWSKNVNALTDGRGADIIVDPVGGAATKEAMRALAWEGRLLVVGFASGEIPAIPANRLLLNRASAIGVYWNHDRDAVMLSACHENADGDAVVRRDPPAHRQCICLCAIAASPRRTRRTPHHGKGDPETCRQGCFIMTALPPHLFEGIRVLDLTRVMSGPFCTAMLADLGAEVIKIEMPGFGEEGRHFAPHVNGESTYFALLNRGKQSVTVNLKTPEGVALIRDLARQADVLVENFRPGVMDRLGLNPAALQADNPRLIVASISGFGQSGAFADLPAFDLVIQAMSGLMSVTGERGGRATAVGESIADVATGMFAAWGIAAALYDRERTGVGRRLDVAMLDSVFSMLLTGLSRRLFTDRPTQRVGNRHPETYPVDSFATKDGDIVLVGFSNAIFRNICDAIGRPDIADDPRFKTNADRNTHEDELRALIADVGRGAHARRGAGKAARSRRSGRTGLVARRSDRQRIPGSARHAAAGQQQQARRHSPCAAAGAVRLAPSASRAWSRRRWARTPKQVLLKEARARCRAARWPRAATK